MEEKEYLDLSVHEMKNILAAISGYSEFIYRGLVHGPKALEMAGKIKHMSDILAAYTDKKYMYDLLKQICIHPTGYGFHCRRNWKMSGAMCR